jgi:hypothetical protein
MCGRTYVHDILGDDVAGLEDCSVVKAVLGLTMPPVAHAVLHKTFAVAGNSS